MQGLSQHGIDPQRLKSLQRALGRHPEQEARRARTPLPPAPASKPDRAVVQIATKIMAERRAKQQGSFLG